MPRTLATGTQAWMAKQGGGNYTPVVLLDVQTADGTNLFWSDLEGYYPSKLVIGTRIQSAGGTATLKYLWDIGLGTTGSAYTVSIAIKNQGAAPIIVYTQLDVRGSTTLQVGESRQVIINVTANGSSDIQLRLETNAAGDSMDVIACNPSIQTIGGANLIPSANQTFIGWTTSGGDAITLTQLADIAPFQFYSGWIKNGFSFTRTRDFTTNAGDLIIQNLSGNTIDRDAAAALKNHEFEGSLCVARLWLPLLDVTLDEFHCALSEATPTEDEISFRELTLFDPTQYFVADDIVSELCTWRYKSFQCSSPGAAAGCNKLFTTCKDVNHTAQERFNGVLTIVPGTIFNQPVGTGGGGVGNGARPPIGVGGNKPSLL